MRKFEHVGPGSASSEWVEASPKGDWLPVEVEARIGGILKMVIVAGIVVFGLLRLWNFTYDVPPHAPLLGLEKRHATYSWDGDVYSDEGFYSNDAINWAQEGRFYLDLEYNQFVNLPLMQLIKGLFLSLLGVSLFAVRLVSLLSAVGMAVALYFLVRRYADPWTALLAVFFLAINHYVFAFSRYAVDEVPVAFLVTLTFALAVRIRGEKWWVYAILTSVTFACAMLTKYNAVFATPLVGAMVIMQELDWRKILKKFVLCSAVFLGIIGFWYVTLVMPHRDDFEYFFSLNVGISSSDDIEKVWHKFERQIELLLMVDWWICWSAFVVTPLLLILRRGYRTNPLVYVSILWIVIYMVMYASYGRFYPRFFPMTVPPMAVWLALSVRHMLDLRGPFRLLTYAFLVVVALSSLWQMHRDVSIVAYGKNTHNEMAADILRIVEADESGNRVVIGHTAGSLALRTGLTPRHDRYSPHSLKDRLPVFQPGWAISEGEFRVFANDSYYQHLEWFELHYEIELVSSYDVLENFRGHKMHFYKLTPRESIEYPPPVVPAYMMDIESVSTTRRNAAAAEGGEQ